MKKSWLLLLCAAFLAALSFGLFTQKNAAAAPADDVPAVSTNAESEAVPYCEITGLDKTALITVSAIGAVYLIASTACLAILTRKTAKEKEGIK
jgi:TRAP-type C4-dicarboxylate transport system permease small subunit